MAKGGPEVGEVKDLEKTDENKSWGWLPSLMEPGRWPVFYFIARFYEAK